MPQLGGNAEICFSNLLFSATSIACTIRSHVRPRPEDHLCRDAHGWRARRADLLQRPIAAATRFASTPTVGPMISGCPISNPASFAPPARSAVPTLDRIGRESEQPCPLGQSSKLPLRARLAPHSGVRFDLPHPTLRSADGPDESRFLKHWLLTGCGTGRAVYIGQCAADGYLKRSAQRFASGTTLLAAGFAGPNDGQLVR